MRRLLERINFPKVFTVLAVTLALAFGACGLTVLASGKLRSDTMLPLAFIECAVMLLSAAGLMLFFILWVIASIMGVNKSTPPGALHLFDNQDNNDHTP